MNSTVEASGWQLTNGQHFSGNDQRASGCDMLSSAERVCIMASVHHVSLPEKHLPASLFDVALHSLQIQRPWQIPEYNFGTWRGSLLPGYSTELSFLLSRNFGWNHKIGGKIKLSLNGIYLTPLFLFFVSKLVSMLVYVETGKPNVKFGAMLCLILGSYSPQFFVSHFLPSCIVLEPTQVLFCAAIMRHKQDIYTLLLHTPINIKHCRVVKQSMGCKMWWKLCWFVSLCCCQAEKALLQHVQAASYCMRIWMAKHSNTNHKL